MYVHLALRRQPMCTDRFENIRHEVRPQASPQANIRRQAGSTGEKKAVLSLWETSLQANRAGKQASPQANIRQQAGSYRGREVCLDFVGACLQANRAG